MNITPPQRERIKLELAKYMPEARAAHVARLRADGRLEEARVLESICAELSRNTCPADRHARTETLQPETGFDAGQLAKALADLSVGLVGFTFRLFGAALMGLVSGGAAVLSARNNRQMSPGELENFYVHQANRRVPDYVRQPERPTVRTTTITETYT